MKCYWCEKEGATVRLKYDKERRPFHPECYQKAKKIELDVGWVRVPDTPASRN